MTASEPVSVSYGGSQGRLGLWKPVPVLGAASQTMNARVVNCPHCGKPVAWDSANRYRPFCSERCRLIDLGAWASENYRIPVAENKDDVETGPEADK